MTHFLYLFLIIFVYISSSLPLFRRLCCCSRRTRYGSSKKNRTYRTGNPDRAIGISISDRVKHYDLHNQILNDAFNYEHRPGSKQQTGQSTKHVVRDSLGWWSYEREPPPKTIDNTRNHRNSSYVLSNQWHPYIPKHRSKRGNDSGYFRSQSTGLRIF